MIWKGVHWGFMAMAVVLFVFAIINGPKWIVIFTAFVSGTGFMTALYNPLCKNWSETCQRWHKLYDLVK